jgi:glycosyltransferase involved in cell wall biosynthesis
MDEPTGVVRTMSNLAGGLVSSYDVEIISLFRFADRPTYPVDPRVRLTYLEDVRRPDSPHGARAKPLRARDDPRRSEADRELDRQPSQFLSYTAPTSALTDRALERCLTRLRAGVLISNRPMLHQPAARWAPRHTLLLAMEHSTIDQRDRRVRNLYLQNAERFDAFVTVTEEDRVAFDALFAGRTRVVSIPNAVPRPGRPVSPLTGKVVLAAGALVPRKGFDRLIEAYAPLASSHPDWQLHIYGKGGERARLQELIDTLDVGDSVVLTGFDPEYQQRLRQASVFALSSHFESFGMVIIEAMAAGVPVVAYDCPSGPRHLIRDGVDGLLIPNGDQRAFTDGLQRLMDDEAFRMRAGPAAVETASAYSIDAVVAMWKALFDDLESARRAGEPAPAPG